MVNICKQTKIQLRSGYRKKIILYWQIQAVRIGTYSHYAMDLNFVNKGFIRSNTVHSLYNGAYISYIFCTSTVAYVI